MIVFFGPTGAGKTTQGQMLANAHSWPYISTGQLLREMRSAKLTEIMQSGRLVPSEKVDELVNRALTNTRNAENIILDGFPRQLVQAHWLIDNQSTSGHSVDLVVVLDIPKPELIKRLKERKRADDTPETIDERINLYNQKINSLLDYFASKGIKIAHIDGLGTINEVQAKIIKELRACNLV
jgi:adenylate kinase